MAQVKRVHAGHGVMEEGESEEGEPGQEEESAQTTQEIKKPGEAGEEKTLEASAGAMLSAYAWDHRHSNVCSRH